MKLTINGEPLEIPDDVRNVRDLLGHFGLSGKIAIVEIDRNIVEKTAYDRTKLEEGSRIEIVHFVGGG
jgi:sulfur carrier protein